MPTRGEVATHLRPFAVTAVAVSLLAAPIAVLWANVVPHAGYILDPDGNGAFGGASDEFIRADGWFLVMSAIVGLVSGVVTWRLTWGRSPGALGGLALGSLFGSFVVARIGEQHNTTQLQLAARARQQGAGSPLQGYYPPLAHGSLLVWAFVAVVVYGLLALTVVRT